MSGGTVFILAVVLAATIAAVAVLLVARSFDAHAVHRPGSPPSPNGRPPVEARHVAKIAPPSIEADRSSRLRSTTAATIEPLVEKVAVSRQTYDVTRRTFFNRAALGLFGAGFLGSLGASILAFLWPKIGEGFGNRTVAGNFDELRATAVQSDGTVAPVFVPAAQAYVVPFIGNPDGGQFGESAGVPLIVGSEGGEPGLMALWQRCVHLGCRVPQCLPSQGFECPCHGSKYNFHGEYVEGPAPRNLDRFAVEIDDNGDLIIDTGTIIETPRAKERTATYPQGPTCI